MDKILQLCEIIREHKNIVFFGGAGVSTESGIPDFRSQDGLYNMKYKYPPERIISHGFFEENPKEFYRFYKDKMIYPEAKPNSCHLALAKLEKEGKLNAVVTQNIDGLHQLAGSKLVYELHGSVLRNFCTGCGKAFTLDEVTRGGDVPKCKCGNIVKPDVVLYGEPLNWETVEGAVAEIKRAEVLIIGGTSLRVYPANSLVDYFSGNKLIVINKEAVSVDNSADLLINENIGSVFEKVIKNLYGE